MWIALSACPASSGKQWGPILPFMNTPQAGIFALGTASHAYLEFDVLCLPHSTTPSCGFREVRRTSCSTSHMRRSSAVKELASVAEETSSWAYRHDRDLTGFIDVSENPSLIDASDAALIPEGQPGEGGSVLLLQKWKHDTTAWESLPIDQQERIIGRRKLDSVELDEKPSDSHVASTDQDQFGRSSAGTCRTAPSPITRQCSWDSVPISGGFHNAGQHGGPAYRSTRRAHALHEADQQRILFRSVNREPSPISPDCIESGGLAGF